MEKLIQIRMNDASILVEPTDAHTGDGIVLAGGALLEKNFDKILENTRPFCETIIKNFEKLSSKPTSISAEFGLKFSLEGNLFVAKAASEANIKVTLNWN